MSLTPVQCDSCLPACENPFDRVVVSYLVRGGTTISWTLLSTFRDPMPYSFQLEVGQSAAPDADDWVNVGSPVTNQFYAVDGEQRNWGKERWQFYRVKLTTGTATYYSMPTALLGTLNPHDWRIARELLRQEMVRMRQFAGQEGYLLKRRITGTPCPVCLDPLTNEIKDPACPTCWGTGFECGYFFPISCVWADVDPKTYHSNLDGQRGTTKVVVCKARMSNIWMMDEEDIWVAKKTDDRYYVHSITNLAEIRGVPLIATVELRPAPNSDPVYGIEIPSQTSFTPSTGRGDY